MARIHISPEAESDLQDIKEYIAVELANPVAAIHTVSTITKGMRRLIAFPDSGAPLSSLVNIQTDYRFVGAGNYLVFYRHEQGDVYIVRVLYNRRDYVRMLVASEHEK